MYINNIAKSTVAPYVEPIEMLINIYIFYSNEKKYENYANVIGADQLKKMYGADNLQYAKEKILNTYLFLLSDMNDGTKINEIHLALCEKLRRINNYPNKTDVIYKNTVAMMQELMEKEINSIDVLFEKLTTSVEETDQVQRNNIAKCDFFLLFMREVKEIIKNRSALELSLNAWGEKYNKDNEFDYYISNIAQDIFKNCHIKREKMLDISLPTIMKTNTYTDRDSSGVSNKQNKFTTLPENIDSFVWVEQMNIEGHDIANLNLNNMTSLHTLRASHSGIVDFALSKMPLLTVVDISGNANLDTINIRKVHTPNLKHLIIDADKIHLLKHCDLPEGCTVHVKHMERVQGMNALKNILCKGVVEYEDKEKAIRLIQKLKPMEPQEASLDKTEGPSAFLSLDEEINNWVKNQEALNPDNRHNIRKAAHRIKECSIKKSTALDLKGFGLKELPACLGSFDHLETLDLDDNALEAFPEPLLTLPNLIRLSLKNNKITTLDNIKSIEGKDIAFKNTLTELDLGGNGLSELSANLFSLEALKSLRLNGNALTRLQGLSTKDWPQLEYLDLGKNNFTTFPAELLKLECLRKANLMAPEIENCYKTLILSDNQICYLPDSVANMKGLNVLDLDNNLLGQDVSLMESVNKMLTGLPAIYILRLDNNEIGTDNQPVEMKLMASELRELSLAGNHIKSLDGSFDKMQRLCLASNHFKAIPKAVLGAPLVKLDLSFNPVNKLAALPESLRVLKFAQGKEHPRHKLEVNDFLQKQIAKLEVLQLDNCLITGEEDKYKAFINAVFSNNNLKRLSLAGCKLPWVPEIENMEFGKNIKYLDLSNTDIVLFHLTNYLAKDVQKVHQEKSVKFVRKLAKLEHLNHLNLSGNDLGWLPEFSLDEKVFPALEVLILRNNFLLSFDMDSVLNDRKSKDRAVLAKLKELDLGNNELKELPPGIGKLIHLRKLVIDKNRQVKEIPWSVSQIIELKELRISDFYDSTSSTDQVKEFFKWVGEIMAMNVEHIETELSPHLISQQVMLEKMLIERAKLSEKMMINIGGLKRLLHLEIRNSVIRAPQFLIALEKLETLVLDHVKDLSRIDATKLPKSLRTLALIASQLKLIPKAIEQLDKLESLNLKNNQISNMDKLPVEKMPRLSKVNMSGNPVNNNNIRTLAEKTDQNRKITFIIDGKKIYNIHNLVVTMDSFDKSGKKSFSTKSTSAGNSQVLSVTRESILQRNIKNSDLTKQIDAWVDEACFISSQELEAREKASKITRNCIEKRSKTLDFSGLNLTCLPPCLEVFDWVKMLNLSGCQYLENLSSEKVRKMQELQRLDVQGCKKINKIPSGLEHLTIFSDKESHIAKTKEFESCLKPWINKQGNLYADSDRKAVAARMVECFANQSPILCLNGLHFTELPDEVSQLTHVEFLVLKDCISLKNINGIRNMQNLSEVDFTGCRLPYQNLIDNSQRLGNLVVVPADTKRKVRFINDLKKWVSEDIENSKSADTILLNMLNKNTVLMLSHIRGLPDIIGELSHLEVLKINNCRDFYVLPQQVAQLHKLRYLDLSGITDLRTISPEIIELPNLQEVNLKGCLYLENKERLIDRLLARGIEVHLDEEKINTVRNSAIERFTGYSGIIPDHQKRFSLNQLNGNDYGYFERP